MKEKTTAFITLGCIFSLFFYYKIYSSDNANIAVVEDVKSTEQVIEKLVEKMNSDDVPVNISDSPDVEKEKDVDCILSQQEIDQMSFSESFKYNRGCNGKGSRFSWKGSEYSTLLASEVVPQKDSNANKPAKSIDKHHLALQQEILGGTVGNK